MIYVMMPNTAGILSLVFGALPSFSAQQMTGSIFG